MAATKVDESGQDTKVDPGKAVAWYKPDVDRIPREFQDLLREYSKIPSDVLVAHVNQVVSTPSHIRRSPVSNGMATESLNQRDCAWKVSPYPCIGGWKFLELNMSLSPIYTLVLSRLRKGETLLDLGCGLGQDIRKLIQDGTPKENLHGVDLSQGLIDAGFDLFLDTESLRSYVFRADIFKQGNARLTKLEGQIDVVFAGSFFHLFDWDEQILVAKRIVELLRARPGSMVFGHQLGHLRAGTYPYGLTSERNIFKHDVPSFVQMWTQLGRETGVDWHVEATLGLIESAGFCANGKWGDGDGRLMRFCVTRT